MFVLKKMMHIPIICFAVFIFFTAAYAQSKPPEELQTLQVFFENDLFGDTDKYYTNAVQFTWISKDLKQYREDVRIPDWLFPVIQAVPFSKTPGSIHNVGIIFGQQIYTPSDIQATILQSNDRPYASFLYTGLALHSKTQTVLNTLEIVAGIVGPDAYAEFAQNTVHELRSIPTAKGWAHQLHNEPAIQLSWQRKWRFYRTTVFDFLDFDLIPNAGVSLGNVKLAANLGGELRFGYHIPKDFGSDVIRGGAGISTPALDHSKSGKKRGGIHLFAGSQIEFIGHDIFLDGNTFTDSHSVDKETVVADFSAGIAINFDRYKLAYRHLYRTRQFENQRQDQIIGSMTLTVSF